MSDALARIDKTRLRGAFQDQLAANLDVLVRRQQDTERAATHAENRPEHSKDTRATEQSYLARGLAVRVAELQDAAIRLAEVSPRPFGPDEAVALTALVTTRVEEETEERTWWLIPVAGGLEHSVEGITIRTITPSAPLGRAMLGLECGDEGSFSTPGGHRSFEILDLT